MKKLILPILIAIFLSTITSYFIYQWMVGYTIDPQIKNTVDNSAVVKLFITWLIYFFALIGLPFLSGDLIKKMKLGEKDFWKVVLGLELFALIFSIVATPPDLFSTILFFFLCQLIVVVNALVVRRVMR